MQESQKDKGSTWKVPAAGSNEVKHNDGQEHLSEIIIDPRRRMLINIWQLLIFNSSSPNCDRHALCILYKKNVGSLKNPLQVQASDLLCFVSK